MYANGSIIIQRSKMSWLRVILVGVCGALAALIAQLATGGPYVVVDGARRKYRFSYFIVLGLGILLLIKLSDAFILSHIQDWVR